MNFLCFSCNQMYPIDIEESKLITFKNEYGTWDGIDCPYCKQGKAKYIGTSVRVGVKQEVALDNARSYIREQRKEHHDSLLQPYREGEFSKEYRDAYPKISRDMVKAGVITQKQFDKARPVWLGDEL